MSTSRLSEVDDLIGDVHMPAGRPDELPRVRPPFREGNRDWQLQAGEEGHQDRGGAPLLRCPGQEALKISERGASFAAPGFERQ